MEETRDTAELSARRAGVGPSCPFLAEPETAGIGLRRRLGTPAQLAGLSEGLVLSTQLSQARASPQGENRDP